ncbi:2-dehydro-3-deoxygalactonokinase [Dyadobacter luticola]|uniref:2-dehydro-3-deoxygalactonokinase n=1 Tax=Dyadobacter luticola TaxID=1979387 RepID=A0A5R9L3L0_9BACT|nr:2-dehydro-3-deoxygalactonokinase [Dyadobacter luticola]TLV02939.1 2-dehydro-3-deoxygalactonokinase [Dyadobacter luticola]
MKKYLLSCDWGTSSFRLRLVHLPDQSIVGEIVSKNGVGDTFNVWREKGIQLMPREEFFKKHLKEQVDFLSRDLEIDLTGVPIVLSGMASSSIGMLEIPYANVPFDLDGSNVLTRFIESQPAFPNEIIIISGARSSQDVMRGEETQLVGLHQLVHFASQEESIFIFPGTHSKHMYVKSGQLVDFKTFMTGEVFNLMATQSILKDSVDLEQLADLSESDWEPFRAGVRESGSGFILNSLFTVRTNQLFNVMSKKQNAMYLSGVLIGSELRYLMGERGKEFALCSGNNLFELYQTGISELGLAENTKIISSEIVDIAAMTGHIRIFEHQKSKLEL